MLSFTLLDNQPWRGEGSVKLLREARMEQKEESIEEERWWMSLRDPSQRLPASTPPHSWRLAPCPPLYPHNPRPSTALYQKPHLTTTSHNQPTPHQHPPCCPPATTPATQVSLSPPPASSSRSSCHNQAGLGVTEDTEIQLVTL